jgi:poly(3-hydroxybutyrate) depolymerase
MPSSFSATCRTWLPSALAVAALAAQAAEPLPALKTETAITVSGVSSGGYMAVQLHVAHSARVKGAGVIAAGPYLCAQGSLWAAYYNCTTPRFLTPVPALAALKGQTEAMAKGGLIDPPANLAQGRAWLFSGTADKIVLPKVVEALRDYYGLFGLKAHTVLDRPAGHAMITENAGNACATSELPYINDCDYDAAGELLQHLLGALKPPAAKESGRLLRFSQEEFVPAGSSMSAEGFAYVPSACDAGGCRVHVAFHGCRQHAAALGDRFAREAGYNRWADGNRLVILYPQAAPGWFPFNPIGCWDWWGYTGPNYATRSGAQIRAVIAMLERLAGPARSVR